MDTTIVGDETVFVDELTEIKGLAGWDEQAVTDQHTLQTQLVGSKVPRVDGLAKVRGIAVYGDDIVMKDMLYGVCRYADIAAGQCDGAGIVAVEALRHGRQSMLISSNGIHHDLDTPQHYQTLYSAYCLSAMAENNF